MAANHSHGHHDHHGHHQGQHGAQAETLAEKNRSHWNMTAADYTREQWQRDLLNQIHEFILTNISWIGVDFIDSSTAFEKPDATATANATRQVRVLDYACGPGTLTNVFLDRATEFIGVDVSENMVKAYNERFASNADGGNPTRARAVVGNLLDADGPADSISGPEFFNFDLAAVGLAFHHFENVELATKRLSARLKPGGVFLIVDFEPYDPKDTGGGGGHHPGQHTVAFHGFSEEDVRKIFGSAGLVDVGVVVMPGEVFMPNIGKRKVFIARGRKA